MTMQRIIPGDCIAGLRTLPDASVHCCVTSPPYWGLRDYGHAGQIGLESTPEAYVARMVEVFREVRRVLRDDGTCWVNLGDSYNNAGSSKNGTGLDGKQRGGATGADGECGYKKRDLRHALKGSGIKHKDLCGIPWRVAFALQADGWWLRQDIIWHKPNPMPESVRDRCTKAHEYVFLLTKSERYFYDAEAIHEKSVDKESLNGRRPRKHHALAESDPTGFGATRLGFLNGRSNQAGTTYPTRNRRSVWTVTTKPYSGAHFAVMPAALVEPCIKAGCPEGGTVLDPFAGSGTTLAVAAELGRNAIGCELNPAYIALAERRIKDARASVALFEGAVA
jgi:DNA modification methylase